MQINLLCIKVPHVLTVKVIKVRRDGHILDVYASHQAHVVSPASQSMINLQEFIMIMLFHRLDVNFHTTGTTRFYPDFRHRGMCCKHQVFQ